ncbi:MAG TPA: hypothetical protein VGJ89_05440 [Geothrix sp.]
MFRRWLSAGLLASFALSTLPATARPDDERRGHRGEREERRDDRRDDRGDDRREDGKYWKERDKAERKYWKERDKEARKHERHRYYDDDDQGEGHDRARHYRAPAWMDGYWRPGDDRRYVALVPGDPSRCYVFLEGRWVLRQIRDPRARLDLEGAFRLPMAPPPVAPPRLGVDLHVVLFN